MNEPETSEDLSVESLLAEAADDFMDRVNRGEQPSVEEYARRFPQIAAMIRQVLPALQVIREPIVTAEPPPPLPDPLGCLGDYRLVREIGRGGMGVVYEAVQVSLDRRVALKVLPFAAALDPRQLQRFKQEAQTVAHLHHTNIVPVYAVGCERGVYYYAMQYVEGQSLAEAIGQRRQLFDALTADGQPVPGQDPTQSAPRQADSHRLAPPTARPEQAAIGTVHSIRTPDYIGTVAQWGVQAAEALDHAHGLGVVHRDIKPANLLVDTLGCLWVTDFGLARFQAEGGLTMTGDLVGTLRYMSPEQALARRGLVDHRTDIYSLGATLYEVLTLCPVFAGTDRHELLQEIANKEPRPPRELNRAIPPDLETIILKALAKAPEERYATAQEMADDLRRFQEHRPIQARRPTLIERAVKWSRRHRSLVTTGLVFLLLAVIGLAATTVVIAQEQARTRAAYEAEARQRIRAENSFRQARKVVDFLIQVSEEELADKPGVQPVRRKVLEAALGYYQDFIQEHADDPQIHDELAASHLWVATILEALGSTEDAQVAYEQARGIQEKLVRDNPGNSESRHRLFYIHNRLGMLHASERLRLIPQKPVQDHLHLTEEQTHQISTMFERFMRPSAEPPDLRGLSWDEVRRRMEEEAREAEKSLATILKPEQNSRLQQVILQQRGVAAFNDPPVVAALALTEEQKDRLRRIIEEQRLPPGPPPHFGPPPKWGWRDPRELARNGMEEALKVLTEEQRTKWKELTGEPFKGGFSPGGFGPRFGSRRPGRP